MRTLISHEIRKTAEFVLFATALNMDKNLLDQTLEELKDILEDKKNFDPVKPGLVFSPAGQKKVKAINPALAGASFLEVLKTVDDAIKTNALREHRFTNLNNYLSRFRAKNWTDIKLPGDYEASKNRVLSEIIEPIENGITVMETSEVNRDIPKRKIEEEYRGLENKRKPLTPKELAIEQAAGRTGPKFNVQESLKKSSVTL
jgi:hypothetical protein